MNKAATTEQVMKAKEDFLKRAKHYFNALNEIEKNKIPVIEYDLINNYYSFSVGNDTETEKNIKKIINEISEDVLSNLHMY